MDKVREECGVFGIFANDGVTAANGLDVAKLTYYGLYALQHRGQQSAGIAVNDDGVIRLHKDNGLVGDVFDNKSIAKLKGSIAVGHVRYGTTEESKREDAQPLVSRYLKGSLTLANNGSLINGRELRESLENEGAIFQSNTDAEIIIIERGEYMSYANCGLPYYIGGEIAEQAELILQTPESFGGRFSFFAGCAGGRFSPGGGKHHAA